MQSLQLSDGGLLQGQGLDDVVAALDLVPAVEVQGREVGGLLVRGDGSEQWLPAKAEGIKVKAGDILYFNTWGGGGWGNPLQREPELVRADVERRLVSAEGARRYGVVIAADGSVDSAATQALRSEMAKGRAAEPALFNFGGSVEELRSRCEAETHLPAPVAPTFR